MLKPTLFKTLLLSSFLAVGAMFVSCGGDTDETGTDEIVVDDDYYEFQDFNLSDFDIDGYIKLPDETANIGASTKPEVMHPEDHLWSIRIGPNFTVLIEDYGDISDLVAEEKKRLADLEFFKVKYLIEEDDMILYERVLMVDGNEKASPTVGVEHRTYHVYGQRNINGINYELKSRAEGFEKNIIELVGKSIKSLRSTKESNS